MRGLLFLRYVFLYLPSMFEGSDFTDARLLDAPGPSPLVLATKP